jgi:hypothetical protein
LRENLGELIAVISPGLVMAPTHFSITLPKGPDSVMSRGFTWWSLSVASTSPGTSPERRLTARAYATACGLATGLSEPTGVPMEEAWVLLPHPASSIAVAVRTSIALVVRCIDRIISGRRLFPAHFLASCGKGSGEALASGGCSSYVAPRRGTESQRARPPRCEAAPPKPKGLRVSREWVPQAARDRVVFRTAWGVKSQKDHEVQCS